MKERKNLRRSLLSDLASYINVNGEEALSDAVGEERTELETAVVENEVQADVMFLRRRRRLGLEQKGAHLLARFYLKVMANEENSLRCHCQKRVMRKMLVKELIPFIHKNLTDSPFEEHWPITGDQFEALNDGLSVSFPKIHAGRRWQVMIQCFERATYRLEERMNAWHAVEDTY